jgi:hypothetical protein
MQGGTHNNIKNEIPFATEIAEDSEENSTSLEMVFLGDLCALCGKNDVY